MNLSQVRTHRARVFGMYLGLAAFGCLLYAILVFGVRRFGSDDQAIRQQFQAAAEAESSGLTPMEIPSPLPAAPVVRQLEKFEPEHAGWDTEVASAAISEQLHHLSDILQLGTANSKQALSQITAEKFEGMVLPPGALEIVFDNGSCIAQQLPRNYSGFLVTDSLAAQLDSLLAHEQKGKTRCHFKVTRIETQGQLATARVLFEGVRSSDAHVFQSNVVCQSQWELGAAAPKLRSMKILDFETVIVSAGGRMLFRDITAAVLGHGSEEDRHAYESQVLRGIGHWSERLTAIDDMSIYGHHGISLGDVNQDGLDDIYVCDSGGLPNRLYVQQLDGTLRDVSRSSNVDWLEATSSALLIDLDNDGDADLVAATVAGVVIASNNGKGVFTIRSAIPGMAEAQSISASDYDNDGDLDLYVTVYAPGGAVSGQRGSEASPPIPYQDANNGGRNVLLANQGGFQFEDVTAACGLDENNRRFSFAAAWEDFDVDGDIDLYVANDFGRNNFYQNDGGMFRDVAGELGVEDMGSGMSVSWGDANQDGVMDLYIGNMYSSAGNRVTYQRRFVSSRTAESSSGIQRMAQGNTLFMGMPTGGFSDVSEAAGVMMGRWAWSSKFVDLNNDGREDLVVANGYFTNSKPDDL